MRDSTPDPVAQQPTVVWQPQPGPQTAFIECPTFERSTAAVEVAANRCRAGEWLRHADMYGPNAIGLVVRREFTQLREMVERSKVLYPRLGATWYAQDRLWRFKNGARLNFAHLDNDDDAEKYQGHSYTRVYIEEIGYFPSPDPILKLMATLRGGAGVPCGFRATGNPGGPGHTWVKRRYIDPSPDGHALSRPSGSPSSRAGHVWNSTRK
jgi:hypothetical protein